MNDEINNIVLLWISPELNHYRIPGLELISAKIKKLIILSGISLKEEGHISASNEGYLFKNVVTDATYRNFNRKYSVYKNIIQILKRHNPSYVLMPIEKKFICIIFFLMILKFFYGFKLLSYNHDLRAFRANTVMNKMAITIYKTLFHFYDKIIFYTKEGMDNSIIHNYISKEKSYYAGNTIDTTRILDKYRLEKDFRNKNIVFIGRIVAKRRLELLIDFFTKLKISVCGCRLYIIGDGPLLDEYKKKFMSDEIIFLGGTTDEEKIAWIMNKSLININTGTTGLSILHCFSYGIPVIAFSNISHPPEIDYVQNGYNGFMIEEYDTDKNITFVSGLLNDEKTYRELSENAIKTAKSLGIEIWSQNIINALRSR